MQDNMLGGIIEKEQALQKAWGEYERVLHEMTVVDIPSAAFERLVDERAIIKARIEVLSHRLFAGCA